MSDAVPDLLIVGGGLVGLSAGYSALRRGLRVEILERERFGSRASWAGAGMLNCRPWPRDGSAVPDYHDLTLTSIPLHEKWAAELLQETGIDAGFVRCGALELYPPGDDTPAGRDNIERVVEGCRARNVRAERLSPQDAKTLEPNVNFDSAFTAVHFPDDAQVRNPRLGKALALACRQRGGVLREGIAVADVWIESDRVRGVVDEKGARRPARNVLAATGAWSAQLPALTRLAPRTAKIEPWRGQMVCYRLEQPIFRRLITVDARYLVPRPDGVLLAGSTMEHVGFESVTTAEGQAELRAFAERLVPALKGVEPEQGWADLRPGLKGNHPILGTVPGAEGLFVAAGHARNGICLAPVSGESIAALLCGEEPPVPLATWLPRAAQPL